MVHSSMSAFYIATTFGNIMVDTETLGYHV